MTTTTEEIRLYTERTPKNIRYTACISMRNYYETEGQFKPSRSIKATNLKTVAPLSINLPQKLSFTDYKLWQINPYDHQWRQKFFTKLPYYMANHFANRYITLFETRGRRIANTFLRETFDGEIKHRLNRVNKKYSAAKPSALTIQFNHELNNFINCSREQLTKLGEQLASYMQKTIYNFLDNKKLLISTENAAQHSLELLTYRFILFELESLTLCPPYYERYKNNQLTDEQATIALAKITLSDWWQKQLKRLRDMQREHLAIAAGLVQRHTNPYASKACVNEWLEQKRRNRHFMKMMAIENQDTQEQFPLPDIVDKSNANPAIRRCELMVRIRGFENIAENMGCVGEFLTLTAPSKYHSVYNKGGFIKNWNGYSPRETQRYLCSIFARIRAKLKRENLRIFGFRVVEPHHDGTPHWHLLLFMLPEQRIKILDIFKYYALAEDGQEKGALENRFKAISIDKTFGSATGYIAKYISKNIDGYSLEGQEDFETGKDLKKISTTITAWASRWKIRQFQQIGGAPVTVWRELRRLKQLKEQAVNHQTIEPILSAANTGDWATYTELQGGPMVTRKLTQIRPYYKKETNQFNEIIKKIRGVFSPLLGTSSFICTRLIKWALVRKLNTSDKNALISSSQSLVSWSSVNNYTRPVKPNGKALDQNNDREEKKFINSTDIRSIFAYDKPQDRQDRRFNVRFGDYLEKLNFIMEEEPIALT